MADATGAPATRWPRDGQRLWILLLVPTVRGGRWWCAALLIAAMFAWLAGAGVTSDDRVAVNLPILVFFCVIVAYIVPVFHFITERTQEAFDELAPDLHASRETVAEWRATINRKSPGWLVVNTTLAVLIWLLQSWFLLGDFSFLSIFGRLEMFAAATAPLFVWLVTSCAVHSLLDNARLFRRLGRTTEIDVLDHAKLMPFGRMTVSSTLAVVGLLASLGIMWLGERVDPWTTIPGAVVLTVALVFLFIVPVWPLHRRVRHAKHLEAGRVQARIAEVRDNDPTNFELLAPLLTYRREVLATSEWPFDLSLLSRLALYLVIVPITWIGAALIEIVVDVWVG